MSKDTQPATTYPSVEQYEAWTRRAEALDMSISGYMKATMEAGHKKFEASADPDATNSELRQQRNDLKRQLKTARRRIRALEDQLHDTEQGTILEHVEENPGATWDEITQKVANTVSGRVTRTLDRLEGTELYREDGRYYLTDEGDE